MKSKYSITRLLVLKKSVEKEIDVLLNSKPQVLSTVVKHTTSQEEKEKLKSHQKAFLDAILAAMKKREIIATAINVSNANTLVTVNGKQMTVAQAIDAKNNIDKSKELVLLMSRAAEETNSVIEKTQRNIDAEIATRAQTLVGREKALTTEALDLAKRSVEDAMRVERIEPVDLVAEISKQRKEIQLFLEEVDIALNESNATTVLELDLSV